nr:hypothetical protein [Halolamina rubra]
MYVTEEPVATDEGPLIDPVGRWFAGADVLPSPVGAVCVGSELDPLSGVDAGSGVATGSGVGSELGTGSGVDDGVDVSAGVDGPGSGARSTSTYSVSLCSCPSSPVTVNCTSYRPGSSGTKRVVTDAGSTGVIVSPLGVSIDQRYATISPSGSRLPPPSRNTVSPTVAV